MAVDKKIQKWAQDNFDYLNRMRQSGIITTDDMVALANYEGKRSMEDQQAIFDRVKRDLNERLSDSKLAEAESKFGKSYVDDLRKFRKTVEDPKKASLLSDQLIKDINESGIGDNEVLSGISKQVKGMSNDELREYLWSGRQYFNQMLRNKDIDRVPNLQEYLTVKPAFGKKEYNFDKMFGDKNVLDKMNDYSMRDIEFIAAKNGLTGKELLEKMSEAKTKKDRYDQAHFQWNWNKMKEEPVEQAIRAGLGIFANRTQEAIERGEEPTKTDIAGDAIEQGLYLMPWNRAIGTGAKALKFLKGTPEKTLKYLSNAAAPTVSKVYDMKMYDDDKRGSDDLLDAGLQVGAGTAANLFTPALVQQTVGRLSKRGGVKGASEAWRSFGEDKTNKEITDQFFDKFKDVNINMINNPHVSEDKKALARQLKDIMNESPELYKEIKEQNGGIFREIASSKGSNMGEKMNSWMKNNKNKGYSYVASDGEVIQADTQDQFRKMIADKLDKSQGFQVFNQMHSDPAQKSFASPNVQDVYRKYLSEANQGVPVNEAIANEAVKNYITNQLGNNSYGEGRIDLPGVNILSQFGLDINTPIREYRDEKRREEEEKKKKKKYESILNQIYK